MWTPRAVLGRSQIVACNVLLAGLRGLGHAHRGLSLCAVVCIDVILSLNVKCSSVQLGRNLSILQIVPPFALIMKARA